MALQTKLPIDRNHRANNFPVMLEPICKIDDLEIANFESQKIASVLLALINFDNKFQTYQIKRLIYPHENGTPIRTPLDVYLFKINANGAKRALFI